MGYMSHNAIIVTGYRKYGEKRGPVDEARDYATSLGCQVTECLESNTNGYVTFVVIPDGSKEGWDGSDAGDVRREAFLAEVKRRAGMTLVDEDDAWFFDWAEIQYGNDDGITRIIAHSDEDINSL